MLEEVIPTKGKGSQPPPLPKKIHCPDEKSILGWNSTNSRDEMMFRPVKLTLDTQASLTAQTSEDNSQETCSERSPSDEIASSGYQTCNSVLTFCSISPPPPPPPVSTSSLLSPPLPPKPNLSNKYLKIPPPVPPKKSSNSYISLDFAASSSSSSTSSVSTSESSKVPGTPSIRVSDSPICIQQGNLYKEMPPPPLPPKNSSKLSTTMDHTTSKFEREQEQISTELSSGNRRRSVFFPEAIHTMLEESNEELEAPSLVPESTSSNSSLGNQGKIRIRSKSFSETSFEQSPKPKSGLETESFRQNVHIHTGLKCSFLYLRVNNAKSSIWKRQWFVVDPGYLLVYDDQRNLSPWLSISLREVELKIVDTMSKPFVLSILWIESSNQIENNESKSSLKLKRCHFVAFRNMVERENWISALKEASSLCKCPISEPRLDEDITKMLNDLSICKREMKHTRRPMNTVFYRNETSLYLDSVLRRKPCDLRDCDLHATIIGTQTQKTSKPWSTFTLYVVQVIMCLPYESEPFRVQSWTIFRRFRQFYELHRKMQEGGAYFCMKQFPPKERNRFDPDIIAYRWLQLDSYLKELVENHLVGILQSKIHHYHFAKFMAPVQMGDIKAENFLMPFDLTPLR